MNVHIAIAFLKGMVGQMLNTAQKHVISQGGIIKMNEHLNNLRDFINSIIVLKKLTEKGILTKEQLMLIESKLREKYSIKHNSLYALDSVAI